MKALVNHPGMQLRDDAADSLERFERDHGVQPLTSAYRPVSEQQALIDRWDAGGVYNRPPYLYAPRRPASAGLHTKGTALDTAAPEAFHVDGERYGWRFLYAYDKVHFEYDEAYDTKPEPVKINVKEILGDEDMIMLDTGNGIGLLTGSALVAADTKSVQGLSSAGIKTAKVTQDFYSRLGKQVNR